MNQTPARTAEKSNPVSTTPADLKVVWDADLEPTAEWTLPAMRTMAQASAWMPRFPAPLFEDGWAVAFAALGVLCLGSIASLAHQMVGFEESVRAFLATGF